MPQINGISKGYDIYNQIKTSNPSIDPKIISFITRLEALNFELPINKGAQAFDVTQGALTKGILTLDIKTNIREITDPRLQDPVEFFGSIKFLIEELGAENNTGPGKSISAMSMDTSGNIQVQINTQALLREQKKLPPPISTNIGGQNYVLQRYTRLDLKGRHVIVIPEAHPIPKFKTLKKEWATQSKEGSRFGLFLEGVVSQQALRDAHVSQVYGNSKLQVFGLEDQNVYALSVIIRDLSDILTRREYVDLTKVKAITLNMISDYVSSNVRNDFFKNASNPIIKKIQSTLSSGITGYEAARMLPELSVADLINIQKLMIKSIAKHGGINQKHQVEINKFLSNPKSNNSELWDNLVIELRNQKAIQLLKEQIAKIPVGGTAYVFFGAEHCPAIVEGLKR